MTVYTKEQTEWLRENAYGNTYEALADAFNARFGTSHTKSAIQHKCVRSGFTSGNPCGFQKGNEFAFSRNPLGDERIEDGYVLVKVEDGNHRKNYRKKCRVEWEKAHGKSAPEGHHIVFLNRDPHDFSPENLRCIENRVMMLMCSNQWWSTDAEATELRIRWCEHYFAIKDCRRANK